MLAATLAGICAQACARRTSGGSACHACMLAQVTHVLLGAHVPTIMGVETNAMQFYPEASAPEARIHPGLYRRTDGCVRIESVRGPGFGYRLDEMIRELPEPAVAFG